MIELAEDKQESVDEPKLWVFKSKFRDDHVRLVAPRIHRNERGEKTVEPAVYADFERNTWSTDDPELADLLRKRIKDRERKNPLHVFETT